MSFKDNLKRDALNSFLNTDEFAEDITYTPKGSSQRTIKAIVNRKRLNPASEDTGRILQNTIEIFIANDQTYGLTAINKGGDKAILPEVIGGVDANYVVIDILGEDDGMWHLLLQK